MLMMWQNSGDSSSSSTFSASLLPSLSLYHSFSFSLVTHSTIKHPQHSNKRPMYESTLQPRFFTIPPPLIIYLRAQLVAVTSPPPFVLTQLHTYTYYHTSNTTTYLQLNSLHPLLILSGCHRKLSAMSVAWRCSDSPLA